MDHELVLYNLEDCPYCHLVRRKLDFLGFSYQVKTVPAQGEDRAELKALSGQSGVPFLVDGANKISDSSKILAYLDQTYGSQPMSGADLGIRTQVLGSYDEVRAKAIEAFKAVGFGLLTEIDVKKTMKTKLDLDMAPYGILGFCNPGYASKGIAAEPDLGLLLPCNVVIRESGAGKIEVVAAHPVKMFAPVGREDMMPLAKEVAELLKKAIATLA